MERDAIRYFLGPTHVQGRRLRTFTLGRGWGRLVANASVEEPLNVSPEFAVAVLPSSFVAEVGVPIDFSVEDVNPPAGYTSILACGDATSGSAEENAPAPEIVCSFDAPGTAYVKVEAVGASSPYAVASALLSESVVPPLAVQIENATASVEVGLLEYIPVELAGGVPPFNVTWQVLGDRSSEEAIVPNDGTFYAAVRVATSGADVLTVEATDSLGITAVSASGTINALSPARGECGDLEHDGGAGRSGQSLGSDRRRVPSL